MGEINVLQSGSIVNRESHALIPAYGMVKQFPNCQQQLTKATIAYPLKFVNICFTLSTLKSKANAPYTFCTNSSEEMNLPTDNSWLERYRYAESSAIYEGLLHG